MKRIITSLTFLLSFFFFISYSYSQTTRYVPTDYPIIQDAIDASDSGDVVILEEGTYHQQINFNGKAITVGSRFILDPKDSSYIENTIIDGSSFAFGDSSSIVYFISGEDSNSVLCGLTLQNGYGTYGIKDGFRWRAGGAISMVNSGGTIRNNKIIDNKCVSKYDGNYGGAIDSYGLPASKIIIIKDNTIKNNELRWGNLAFGGGINCDHINGGLFIDKNIIENNNSSASGDGGNGAGLAITASESYSIYVRNNFIHKNSVLAGTFNDGGGIMVVNSTIHIFNNIITENSCNGPTRGRGGSISVGTWESSDPSKYKAYIVNNTIYDNYAQNLAGGIYIKDIYAELFNNIFRENKDPLNRQITVVGGTFETIVEYSNIEGGYAGEGNIDVDPNFCDTTYCILDKDSSKCIDAGNPFPIYDDVLSEENNVLYPSRGTRRNDMGAFGGPNSKWTEMSIIPTDPATSIEKYNLNLPESFELSQNYPNPFNPTTTIKYSLPSNVKSETGNVKLIIYDLLGKEIITLVNQKQKPGNYKVTWNGLSASGGQVPSGVCFYKLKVSAPIGDFIETKKMILLK